WKALFEGHTPVPALPPLPAGEPKVAAVIESTIEAFDFGLPFLKSGIYTAEITYRFKLYAPDGTTLASGPVGGSGAHPGHFGLHSSRGQGKAADLTMQSAATNLAAGFRYVPEVRAWLRNAGVVSWWTPKWLAAAMSRLLP